MPPKPVIVAGFDGTSLGREAVIVAGQWAGSQGASQRPRTFRS